MATHPHSEQLAPVAAQNAVAVEVRDAARHYAMGATLVRALDGVSLTIAAREFVCLLGSSGSGKSTLLNIIAGLDRPTAGQVTIFGRELAGMASQELARYRRETVGIVFQSFNLIPTMSVEENVELPLRFAEVERAERSGRTRLALDRVRLSHRVSHRPSELSGGEQQRVAIARALVNRPSLLLADEPTGNLDSRTGEEIMNLLREFNRELGMTVVMVTHERSLADRFADRMLFLADGKLVPERSERSG
ncbi:MAG TPA: ABC transporter ATP-binding protein [Terriglobales bacterium]|nr:ABC transporter ATP-binding protein [Terriglobales bacterium]